MRKQGLFGDNNNLVGSAATSTPGSGWLNRATPAIPRTAPRASTSATPAAPTAATPAAPTAPRPAPIGGVMNPTTPQGFATWAGMLRPVTEAVGGIGGMPALMGIYGAVSGNRDWRTAMTQQPATPQMSPSTIPQYHLPVPPQRTVTAAARLPLPAASTGGLEMPVLEKFANNNWGRGISSGATALPNWGAGGISPTAGPSPWRPTILRNVGIPVPQAPDNPVTPPTQTEDNAQVSELGVRAGQLGAQIGMRSVAPRLLGHAPHALERATAREFVRRGAPAALVRRAARFPIGSYPGVGTLINSGTDLLDAAGIYNMDQSEENPHFWRRPQLNAQGQRMRDPTTNEPLNETGWNPGAFGWDMREFQRGTTPSNQITRDFRTGIPLIDYPASYGMSSARAYYSPLKSFADLGRFSLWDANPITQSAFNSSERAGWGNIARGRAATGSGHSIPLTLLSNAADSPSRPPASYMPGGEYHEREAEIHRRQNRYHPAYNPQGTVGAPSWFGGRLWNRLRSG